MEMALQKEVLLIMEFIQWIRMYLWKQMDLLKQIPPLLIGIPWLMEMGMTML